MPTHLKPTKQPTHQQAHPHPTRFDLNLHIWEKFATSFHSPPFLSQSWFSMGFALVFGLLNGGFGNWYLGIWNCFIIIWERKTTTGGRLVSCHQLLSRSDRQCLLDRLTFGLSALIFCRVDLVFNIVNLEFGGTRILEFCIWRQLRCCCQLFPGSCRPAVSALAVAQPWFRFF